MDDNTRATILAKLNDAARAIAEARLLLLQQPPQTAYATRASTILAALAVKAPQTLVEIVTATGMEYTAAALALSRLHREGLVARERERNGQDYRVRYAYRPTEGQP